MKQFSITNRNTRILRTQDNEYKEGSSVGQCLDAYSEDSGEKLGSCPTKQDSKVPPLTTDGDYGHAYHYADMEVFTNDKLPKTAEAVSGGYKGYMISKGLVTY